MSVANAAVESRMRNTDLGDLGQRVRKLIEDLADANISDFAALLSGSLKESSPSGRRVRIHWSNEEVEKLLRGVIRCGIGNWSSIHSAMKFDNRRTFTDLKDKWRNLLDPRCSSRSIVQYKHMAAEIKRQLDEFGVVREECIFGNVQAEVAMEAPPPTSLYTQQDSWFSNEINQNTNESWTTSNLQCESDANFF